MHVATNSVRKLHPIEFLVDPSPPASGSVLVASLLDLANSQCVIFCHCQFESAVVPTPGHFLPNCAGGTSLPQVAVAIFPSIPRCTSLNCSVGLHAD